MERAQKHNTHGFVVIEKWYLFHKEKSEAGDVGHPASVDKPAVPVSEAPSTFKEESIDSKVKAQIRMSAYRSKSGKFCDYPNFAH